MGIPRRLLLLSLWALAFPAIGQQTPESAVPDFSEIASLEDGWEPLEFPDINRHTQYQLVQVDDQQVVKAITDNSASGLITRLSVDPGNKLMLRWRWKVSNVYEQGDARKKSGDDYPARIYVAFEFEAEEAGWFERAKRKAAEAIFGEELPGNALNYIWASRLPEGEVAANPFTGNTMMLAVNSGPDQVGEWVSVERDIVADYRAAFGEDPPRVIGIAIMSDSDNAGESATAWYGDITLSR